MSKQNLEELVIVSINFSTIVMAIVIAINLKSFQGIIIAWFLVGLAAWLSGFFLGVIAVVHREFEEPSYSADFGIFFLGPIGMFIVIKRLFEK